MNRRWIIAVVVMTALMISGCGTGAANESNICSEADSSQAQTESAADSETYDDADSAADPIAATTDDTNTNPEATRDIFAMDTYMSIHTYGEKAEDAANEAVEEIHRLNELFSVGIDTSEISVLNREKTAQVSEDTMTLITRSQEISESTGGVFDITVFPMMQAWGFVSGDYRVPSQEEINTLLGYVNMSDIKAEPSTGTVTLLGKNTAIDLGGIAKGYTSARLMDVFRSYGLTSGLVSLGGNVQVLGTKPDGSLWRVGIENPQGGDYLGVLSTKDAAVITSGGYERYFEENGKHYHHILDPATGYPAESGLVSVTIVSPDGTLADALSTALFVMGRERAEEYWRAHADEFDVILQDEGGTIYVSQGIWENFEGGAGTDIVEITAGEPEK